MSDNGIRKNLEKLSDKIEYDGSPIAVILAAGHGKRIKSQKSKMLHEIWGKPTVLRVASATAKGLNSNNQIIVVGIKAEEVAKRVGKDKNRIFVFQEEQKGTGDAAKVSLSILDERENIGDIYIFPGDMGLLTPEVVKMFKEKFESSDYGMLILTGIFEGNPRDNYYGRIVRVPEYDSNGIDSGAGKGRVVEIKEYKDIIYMNDGGNYRVNYRGRKYSFSKEDLLNISEYNSGAYAVKFNYINSFISQIGTENVQNEYYITDLISIFNRNNIPIGAVSAKDNTAVMGFNNKSVLYEMQKIYQARIWDILKDLVYIDDENDFFIADEVVNQILEMDSKYPTIDIRIGKGVYLGKGVKIAQNISLGSGTKVIGKVTIGEGVSTGDDVVIESSINEGVVLGLNCKLGHNSVLKGKVEIGERGNIENGIIISGDNDSPTIIGKNVTIKGITKIFGSIIEDDVLIEHSILDKKQVKKLTDESIRFVLPEPEGAENISDKSG
jgi:bifunctional UDP-N-acetylglucosamine pyrophosphorylase/glucosamine-1-phosphate N-acetyltransferase